MSTTPVTVPRLGETYDAESSAAAERQNLALRERAWAWRIVALFAVINVAQFGAITWMATRPPPEPVMISNVGGQWQRVTTASQGITKEEALDIQYLSTYVRFYEGYNGHQAQHTYDTVRLMSAPDVQLQFRKLYEGHTGRDEQLGYHTQIDVKVTSIQVHEPGKTATVRFSTAEIAQGARPTAERDWVALVTYRYDPARKMEDRERAVNALGFTVTSYKVAGEAK